MKNLTGSGIAGIAGILISVLFGLAGAYWAGQSNGGGNLDRLLAAERRLADEKVATARKIADTAIQDANALVS